HMVLVGHSQGGLLCQLQGVDGDVSWWQELTGTPLADSGFSPEPGRHILELTDRLGKVLDASDFDVRPDSLLPQEVPDAAQEPLP
ncbi:MAG: hypothetical protein AAB576_02680, partial [Elusimicrobiota bacterium]